MCDKSFLKGFLDVMLFDKTVQTRKLSMKINAKIISLALALLTIKHDQKTDDENKHKNYILGSSTLNNKYKNDIPCSSTLNNKHKNYIPCSSTLNTKTWKHTSTIISKPSNSFSAYGLPLQPLKNKKQEDS